MKLTNIDTRPELTDSLSILDELAKDIELLDFAGASDIPKLIYLVLQTRRFKRPVSMVIKGPSGSGKSFSLNTALKFVPSSSYEAFSGMSERAIIYSGLDLQNRHLVIGEAAGLTNGPGRAFLRQLISEDSVRYLTVQSTDKGVHGQELPPVKGPCGLIMTTTANGIHPEDESRMLSLNMVESSEQIKRALLAQAKGRREDQQPDLTRWHAFDELISANVAPVTIPFAEELAKALPTTHFRVQRDFPQVLSLIQAHALLHKCTRPNTTDGEILATLEDYSAVYKLVNGPLSQGLETAVPDNIRLVVEAVAAMLEGLDSTEWNPACVSQRQLSNYLGRDQSVISRNVSKAIDEGYLANSTQGQGREAKLVLGERQLPQGYVLPAPEQLKELTTA